MLWPHSHALEMGPYWMYRRPFVVPQQFAKGFLNKVPAKNRCGMYTSETLFSLSISPLWVSQTHLPLAVFCFTLSGQDPPYISISAIKVYNKCLQHFPCNSLRWFLLKATVKEKEKSIFHKINARFDVLQQQTPPWNLIPVFIQGILSSLGWTTPAVNLTPSLQLRLTLGH